MTEGERVRRIRVLNEIGFIHSDQAHGGPDRTAELERLRAELKELIEPADQAQS
jgi:hypothetical protein